MALDFWGYTRKSCDSKRAYFKCSDKTMGKAAFWWPSYNTMWADTHLFYSEDIWWFPTRYWKWMPRCNMSSWSLQGPRSWQASHAPMYKQILSHLPILTNVSCSSLPWLCGRYLLATNFGLWYSLRVFLACAIYLRRHYFIDFGSSSRTINFSKHFQFHLSVSGDKTWASVRAWPHKEKPLCSSKYREVNLGNCLHSKARTKKLNGSSDVTEMNQYTISQKWILGVSRATRPRGWGHSAEKKTMMEFSSKNLSQREESKIPEMAWR